MEGIKLNFKWISAYQYHKQTGMSYPTVLKLCKNKELECIRDGKHYVVKVYLEDNFITFRKYEKILEENIILKEKLNNILMMCAKNINH